jgi:hypothetical protein
MRVSAGGVVCVYVGVWAAWAQRLEALRTVPLGRTRPPTNMRGVLAGLDQQRDARTTSLRTITRRFPPQLGGPTGDGR